MTDDTSPTTRAPKAGSPPPAGASPGPGPVTAPARVGGPARGYSWPPFEEGHTLSLKHGAFSRYVIPEADEMAAVIVEAAPHLTPADAPAVRDYCIAQVRAWRLAQAVEASGELDAKGKPVPTLAMLRDWLSRAEKARSRLGLDPMSRAALAVDELVARRQHAALATDMQAQARAAGDAARARLATLNEEADADE